MGGLAGKEQILTAVGPRASLSRRYCIQTEILSYTQTDKKKLLQNILELHVERLQNRDEQ